MCRALAQRGLLAGGSSGSVLRAVQMSGGDIAPGETVVAIAPDMGDKYLDTVYDPDWAATYFADMPTHGATSPVVQPGSHAWT
jgi:cysteine synthase A